MLFCPVDICLRTFELRPVSSLYLNAPAIIDWTKDFGTWIHASGRGNEERGMNLNCNKFHSKKPKINWMNDNEKSNKNLNGNAIDGASMWRIKEKNEHFQYT